MKCLKTFSILFIILILPFLAFAQSKLDSLNTLLDQYQKEDAFQGVILIARDGKIILNKSMGYAHFPKKIPLTDTTAMPLASLSKSFTGAAILLLMEQGKLRLEDPVQNFLPEFPYPQIQIQHLIYHSSGLLSLYDRAANKAGYIGTREVRNFVAQKQPKLKIKPGEQFLYSNTGYCLLAAIVEEISGKSFGAFLEREIFTPLGMANSFQADPDQTDRFRAASHNAKNQIKEYLPGAYPGAAWICASAQDLLQWDQAWYGDQLLHAQSRELAYQGIKYADGRQGKYGFGWKQGIESNQVIYSNGDWQGHESLLLRYLNTRQTIIILANRKNKIGKWELVEKIIPLIGLND